MESGERLMKRLRLLITESCDRDCEGCCNKQWDLSALEVETDFSQYDEILITGGEPMLNVAQVMAVIQRIREQNSDARIYVYTAKVDNVQAALDVLWAADGLTVTLHEQSDVQPFLMFNDVLWRQPHTELSFKSLRVNIFSGIELHGAYLWWEEKRDIEWIEDCPLPEGEVLKRLERS